MIKWKGADRRWVLIRSFMAWLIKEPKVVGVSPCGDSVKLIYPDGTTVTYLKVHNN